MPILQNCRRVVRAVAWCATMSVSDRLRLPCLRRLPRVVGFVGLTRVVHLQDVLVKSGVEPDVEDLFVRSYLRLGSAKTGGGLLPVGQGGKEGGGRGEPGCTGAQDWKRRFCACHMPIVFHPLKLLAHHDLTISSRELRLSVVNWYLGFSSCSAPTRAPPPSPSPPFRPAGGPDRGASGTSARVMRQGLHGKAHVARLIGVQCMLNLLAWRYVEPGFAGTSSCLPLTSVRQECLPCNL